MIARHIAPKALQGEPYFRWRGGDVSRVESLSDIVFAIALTLIVVSLEVPRTFSELIHAFEQLPVFAACFAVLLMCWHYNYKFHRRYGFEDFTTEVLNAVLLFLILLYVYPLRFLFDLLWAGIRGQAYVVRAADGTPVLGPGGAPIPAIDLRGEGQLLMILYSGGFAAIFGLLALMNARAWAKRDQLGLDAAERQITRATIGSHLIMTGFGAVSVALAGASRSLVPPAGWIFFFIGPAQGIFWFWQGRKVDRAVRAQSRHRAVPEAADRGPVHYHGENRGENDDEGPSTQET